MKTHHHPAYWSCLLLLFFVDMSLGDSGCRVVAEELTNNTTLTKLNLEGTLIFKPAHTRTCSLTRLTPQKTESVTLVWPPCLMPSSPTPPWQTSISQVTKTQHTHTKMVTCIYAFFKGGRISDSGARSLCDYLCEENASVKNLNLSCNSNNHCAHVFFHLIFNSQQDRWRRCWRVCPGHQDKRLPDNAQPRE